MTAPLAPQGLLAALGAERARRDRLKQQKAAAEEDLVAFIRMMWPIVEPVAPFKSGWPLEAMADALMAVTDGHIKRLVINIFPGAMKSFMLNVFWPAWEWGPKGMPHMRYISTSYSAGVTERDNERFLRIIQDPVYQELWGKNWDITKSGKEMVASSKTGWKMATSVGGKMTGFRGDRILIDDPNNPNDVDSETVRDATNLWLREVMPDRLNNLDQGAIVCIQQRAHEHDATYTLTEHATGYQWLCIPMEFDPLRRSTLVLRRDDNGQPESEWADPRGLDEDGYVLDGLYFDEKGREKVRPGSPMAEADGQLAWPERFSPQAVEATRHDKGPYAYALQYQQATVARASDHNIRRDWWQYWAPRTFPDFGTVVASLDTALEEKKQNDWNALVGLGAFPNENGAPQIMLRYAEHKKMPLADLVKWVYDACIQIKADYLLIEHKTRGRDVYDEIIRQYRDAPFKLILMPVSGDKISRMDAVQPLFSGDKRVDPVSGIEIYENGMVWAPDTLWAEEVINECESFPNGAHDDYCDAVTQGILWMRKNGVVLRKIEHDYAEDEKKKFRRAPSVPYAIGKR